MDKEIVFQLPGKIENVLGSLATYFEKQGRKDIQKVIVNSHCRVHEKWSYDNWNGGICGHALYLQLPSELYYDIVDELDEVVSSIEEKINRFTNVQDEFIEVIFIERQEEPIPDNWRLSSGLLINPKPPSLILTEDKLRKIWKQDYFKLFISHKAEYKAQTSRLKEELDYYGVSGFVAHEDIEPTKEWQDKIKMALFSMDALLVLLTDNFTNSHWTDQEIGVAVGRCVPIIPVGLGTDPYGFIGKYQALQGNKKTPKALAKEIYTILWTMHELDVRLMNSLVTRFEKSDNYDQANTLFKYFERFEKIPSEIIDRIEKAPENERQVREANEVKRDLSNLIKRLRQNQI